MGKKKGTVAKKTTVVALAILGGLLFAGRAVAKPAELFIAPQGSDKNPGTRQKPFASLERARDAIRAMKQARGGALPAGGVTVWLRGGAYRRETSFLLEAEDSGTGKAPIVYRAFPGEVVRLVGGVVIPPAAFRSVSAPSVLSRLDAAARGKVMQADLHALGITKLGDPFPVKFQGYAGWPELFFDGAPMHLARWPNEGFTRMAGVVDSGSKPRWNEKPDRPGTFKYLDDRPQRWLQADEVYLNGYWAYKWYSECVKVGKIDPDTKQITLAVPCMYGVGGPSGGEYYAMNLLEELDAPGEYYLDRKTGYLYFWPPAAVAGKDIGLSLLETPLVTLQDTSYLTLRGLTFELTRGMAATIENGHHNLLVGCTVRNIANDAIRISGGHDNGVRACNLHHLGGGGVTLSGGDRATLTPCRNFAENNHIHHFGRLFRTHHDAINLNGVGCRASYNLIHDAPHHAMDFGGNDHLIEYNEIHHVCLETDDAGAIYTGRNWTVRGTVIRHNFLHHIGGGPSVGNQAIYLDDTACGTICYGNVVYKVHRAFLIGGGRDNIVRNNIIVDCSIPVHIDNRGMGGEWDEGQEVWHTLRNALKEVPYREEPWRSRYPALANILEDNPGLPKGNVVEKNLIVDCGEMSLAPEARPNGTIENNWVTNENVGFIDAAHLNFRLRPGSPVGQHIPGFQSVPFRGIGLRKDADRRVLPPAAPWVEPAAQTFVGELLVTMKSRSTDTLIRYTLDGTEPTASSPLYRAPVRLSRTVTVKAATFLRGGGGHSDSVSVHYTARQFGPGQGIYLSDLPPTESFLHGSLLADTGYDGGSIRIGGRAFAKGIITHPEATPTGGRAQVTWMLTGGLSRAKRFKAYPGVDDSARGRGSVTFAVEARRQGKWENVFQSSVVRGGQTTPPDLVDVDITGADALRLITTDAGDSIDSDHAAWGDARIE